MSCASTGYLMFMLLLEITRESVAQTLHDLRLENQSKIFCWCIFKKSKLHIMIFYGPSVILILSENWTLTKDNKHPCRCVQAVAIS